MTAIKNGRWVRARHHNQVHVGVMFAAGEEVSTVHVVNAAGETTEWIIVANAQIERAAPTDVPVSRRAKVT